MKLHYVGHGEYIPGIPAGDLDEDTIETVSQMYGLSINETIDHLIARGLYVKVADKTTSKSKASPTIDKQETELSQILGHDTELTGE